MIPVVALCLAWLLAARWVASVPAGPDRRTEICGVIAVGLPLLLLVGLAAGALGTLFFAGAGLFVLGWPRRPVAPSAEDPALAQIARSGAASPTARPVASGDAP